MLNSDITKYIDQSVLCWLATVSADGQPNVSPKEIFAAYGGDRLIIANVASPQSVRNILENPLVCVSFVDVFVQKGYQLKGEATVIRPGEPGYKERQQKFSKAVIEKFSILSIIDIKVKGAKPIFAPSYIYYPETSEEEQIAQAVKTYKKASGLG